MAKPLILLIILAVLSGCVTYPSGEVDETDTLLVWRATGKTKYEAMQTAEEDIIDEIGVYIKAGPPDCNYNPGKGQQNLYGTGVYEDVGSWHECVLYAKKPKKGD